MRRPGHRGFTLIEVAVTLGIIAVLGALAYDGMRRTRPRATFNGVSAELQSLVHAARLQALAEGVSVAVLVFPDYRSASSQGRLIVYQESTDPASSLFNTSAALTLDNYLPGTLAAGGNGQVVTTLDLPSGVNFGPDTGLGVAALPFPYNNVATNVTCSFCRSDSDHRGAMVFDSRGRATFYDTLGPTSTHQQDTGGSISICGPDLVASGGDTTTCGAVQARGTFTTSTLVITGVSGTGRTFHNG